MKIFVNSITIVRFLYTLVLPIIYGKISNIAFIINVVVLFLTDSIDGILARKYKVQTLFGSAMDTIADKTLCIVLVLMIIGNNQLLKFIVIGEIIITIINIIVGISGKRTKANIFGKLKMWIVSIAVILSYMAKLNIINNIIVDVGVVLSIIAQLITIISYIVLYKNQPKDERLKKDMKKIESIDELKYILFDTNYYLKSL